MYCPFQFVGYRIYRTSTTQHPSDPVLDSFDCPRFVRFAYADIVIRTSQLKSHFGEVLCRLIDDDVLENATISIACLLHVFPTRQHVGSFLRTHVLPTDGQCANNGKFRTLELWGDHVPRIRTENESDVPLLGLLANLSDISLRFSSSVYNDSNYRLQIARSLDESTGFADTTDEAEYGLGLIVSLDEIIWWLERNVTTVQRRPRHLYVTQSTMNCIDNWFTIVQLVTLLREKMPDVLEFNVGGQIHATTYETIASDKKCALYMWYIERKGSTYLTKDKKGRYFIDRDPSSFGIILNFLRLQSAKQLWEVCLPKDPDRLALLTQEADYFRLPQLRDQAIALLKCSTGENGGGYLGEVRTANGRGNAAAMDNGEPENGSEEEEEDQQNGRWENKRPPDANCSAHSQFMKDDGQVDQLPNGI